MIRSHFPQRCILWYVPLGYGVCFFLGSYLQLRYFVLNDWDFGYFLTQPWRIAQGLDCNVPFAAVVDGAPFWAHHFTPLSFVLAPLFKLFPSEYTLSFLHAGSVTAVAFLLPRLTRQIYAGSPEKSRWLWTAGFLLLIFFMYRPFISAWSRQTHFTTLVSPFLALAILCLHKHWRVGAIFCALMLCLGQERASVAVFGLGMYAIFLLREKNLGVFFCTFSLLWFFCVTQVVLPWLREYAGAADTTYVMTARIGLMADWPQKLRYIFLLCAFSCFLPFCGKKALLCASCSLPNIAMSLVAKTSGMYDFKGQYEDLPAIFLLLSMAYGLQWIQGKLSARQWRLIFAAGSGLYWLAILTTASGWYTPLATPLRLLTAPQRPVLEILNAEIRPLQKPLPEDVTLYAQSGLGPRMSLHAERRLLRMDILQQPLKGALIVLSPLCGAYRLKTSVAEAIKMADRHKDLVLLYGSDRLRVYASRDVAAAEPELVQRFHGVAR